MIEALLHGKLTPKQENMEDILTSNVFGMLQYVQPKLGLFRFLAQARTIEGEYPLKGLSGGLGSVKYQFWPQWEQCEPDVELCIQSGDDSYLVGIEAKYRSGKSSKGTDVEEQTDDDLVRECTDQLAVEWIALSDAADRRNKTPILIYLTAHVSCPKEQIKDSLNDYRSKRAGGKAEPIICWLSWRELPELFRGDSVPLLKALARMAEERMDLIFFQGIRPVAPIRAEWKFEGPPLAWRFKVRAVTFQWGFRILGKPPASQTWCFQIEPIKCQWGFRHSAAAWRFQAAPIICQWKFAEPTPTWHFKVAPIAFRWRFKR